MDSPLFCEGAVMPVRDSKQASLRLASFKKPIDISTALTACVAFLRKSNSLSGLRYGQNKSLFYKEKQITAAKLGILRETN
jgi:hypothetical protein